MYCQALTHISQLWFNFHMTTNTTPANTPDLATFQILASYTRDLADMVSADPAHFFGELEPHGYEGLTTIGCERDGFMFYYDLDTSTVAGWEQDDTDDPYTFIIEL